MFRKFLLLFLSATLAAVPAVAEDNPCADVEFNAPVFAFTIIDTECVEYTRENAEQGQVKAQFNLALSYHYGYGVEKDARAAVYWFRAAAEQGHGAAQNWLGLMYDSGEGVIANGREAYIWLLIAKTSGDELAAYLVSRYEKEIMSSEEIKSAKREAAKRMIKIENRRIGN